MAAESTHQHFVRGLVAVHEQLRSGAEQVRQLAAASSPHQGAQLASAVDGFTETLLDHHRSEDVFFFPAFRAAARLSRNDSEFLDLRDAEHVPIHRLAVELRDLLPQFDGRRVPTQLEHRVTANITELGELSLPHFAEEERVLTADHLATMITDRELGNVYRDMGRNWNRT
ncbi:MAG: hypothetical protein EPO13_08300 [Actinomycetota bacterium]|nr:MAG: hypothetical protein EPO13_08300 [Actinomycetota bacterium]